MDPFSWKTYVVHTWAYGLAQKFRVFTDLLGPSWLLRGWGKVELGLRTLELGQEVLVSAAVRAPCGQVGELCSTRLHLQTRSYPATAAYSPGSRGTRRVHILYLIS